MTITLSELFGNNVIIDDPKTGQPSWIFFKRQRALLLPVVQFWGDHCDAGLECHDLPDLSSELENIISAVVSNYYGEPNDTETRDAISTNIRVGLLSAHGDWCVHMSTKPEFIDAGILAGYAVHCIDEFRWVYAFKCRPTDKVVAPLVPIVHMKAEVTEMLDQYPDYMR